MKVTLAVIAGIAAGVCIGMLLAPEKGSETRKKLADSAGDWMEKLKDLFSAAGTETSGGRSRSYKQSRTT